MEHLFDLPVLATAAIIFFARIIDVSLGTIRTISLVNGRAFLAVFLGFFEVLVWILVVSKVITSIKDSPILLVAYAAGFATGNGVGIALEKWLALGTQVLRVISANKGEAIAAAIRDSGGSATVFEGVGRDGPVQMVFVTNARKIMPRLLEQVRAIDPDVFYVIEHVAALSRRPHIPMAPTGWRSVEKKK